MTKKRVLGLDVSSSCIGWGLLEIDEQKIAYLDSGLIKPPKDGTLLERLAKTRDEVLCLFDKHKPDYIGIEDIINFIRNKSSANTIITLAVFNRMIGLLSLDFLNKSPQLFSVLDIRHGLKTNKKLPKKEEMPELVSKHLRITFPYRLVTRGKNKGKPNVTSYDRSDGIAVALYYAFVLTNKVKRKNR